MTEHHPPPMPKNNFKLLDLGSGSFSPDPNLRTTGKSWTLDRPVSRKFHLSSYLISFFTATDWSNVLVTLSKASVCCMFVSYRTPRMMMMASSTTEKLKKKPPKDSLTLLPCFYFVEVRRAVQPEPSRFCRSNFWNFVLHS